MKGQWYVLMAAVLWGTTGTAQALAPANTSPLGLGAVRMIIGGSALLILALARGAIRRGASWAIWPTTLAAASMAAYQVFFFSALLKTGVAMGTIVAIGSAPIITGGLGLLLEGDRPRRQWIAATTLAIIGCALLFAADKDVQVETVGIIFALAAGTFYATSTLASKALLDADHSPDEVMAVIFFLAAVLSLPLIFLSDFSWLSQPRGMASAAHLGLIATALAYTLFARGLKLITSATAVSLALAEPLTAGALGILLLGERLTTLSALGIGLVLLGMIILTLHDPPPPLKLASDERVPE